MKNFTTESSENHRDLNEINELTQIIIGAAIRVHSVLGPGLLESAYEACLKHEINKAGIKAKSQVPLPVFYDSVMIDVGYRLDLLVENTVIVELKAVESVSKLHEAQLMSYLKLSGKKVGLILNFNVTRMKDGIIRKIS